MCRWMGCTARRSRRMSSRWILQSARTRPLLSKIASGILRLTFMLPVGVKPAHSGTYFDPINSFIPGASPILASPLDGAYAPNPSTPITIANRKIFICPPPSLSLCLDYTSAVRTPSALMVGLPSEGRVCSHKCWQPTHLLATYLTASLFLPSEIDWNNPISGI